MQREFLRVAPPDFEEGLVSRISHCLSAARSQGIPVIHVITQYQPDKSDWPVVWSDRDELWCIRDTDGARIMDGLEPIDDEPVIVKTRFTAFYGTSLDSCLLEHHIQGIALAGYASDVCVRMTAMDAYNRGIPTTILSDCVLPERAPAEDALEYLRWLTNCRVEAAEAWLGG